MRISIFATGSRGDIVPYVALGSGLCGRGHQVRLVSFADAARWVEGTPIEFFPIAADFGRFMNSELGKTMVATQNDLVGHVRAIAKFSEALAQSTGYWESYEKACEKTDLIIYSVNAPQGFHLAEKFNIPAMGATYLPVLTPTGDFASPMWPVDVHLGRHFNLLTHKIVEQFMWRPFRRMMNQWRTSVLNLPPMSWHGPFQAMRRSPILYGASPLIIPKPKDWGESVHVTGFWHPHKPFGWLPPPALEQFLNSGPKPVYIGFGSMVDRSPRELATLAIEALSQTGQRGILAMDEKALNGLKVPNTIFLIPDAPHDWLFPRVSVVVHHAGAGTTASALKAGIPSIPVPFFSDQPFWARRLQWAKVSPPPFSVEN